MHLPTQNKYVKSTHYQNLVKYDIVCLLRTWCWYIGSLDIESSYQHVGSKSDKGKPFAMGGMNMPPITSSTRVVGIYFTLFYFTLRLLC